MRISWEAMENSVVDKNKSMVMEPTNTEQSTPIKKSSDTLLQQISTNSNNQGTSNTQIVIKSGSNTATETTEEVGDLTSSTISTSKNSAKNEEQNEWTRELDFRQYKSSSNDIFLQTDSINTETCKNLCRKDVSVEDSPYKLPPKPDGSQTCDKLFPTKKRRSCCNDQCCPINDPTTSTYEFLMKIRKCCNTRNCELASRICDIYEPLVQINAELLQQGSIGDPQYHYLASDAYTEPQPEKEPKSEAQPEPGPELALESNTTSEAEAKTELPINQLNQTQSVKSNTKLELPTEVNKIESAKSGSKVELPVKKISSSEPNKQVAEKADENTKKTDSDITHLSNYSTSQHRTSTVSWTVPENIGIPKSYSQDQVISQATAETDKFRNMPVYNNRTSVFGEAVRQTMVRESKDLIPVKQTSDIRQKSQVTISVVAQESEHKQKCWPRFKRKFKKKNITLRDPSNSTNAIFWQDTQGRERRRTKVEPVPGKEKHEITAILHGVTTV